MTAVLELNEEFAQGSNKKALVLIDESGLILFVIIDISRVIFLKAKENFFQACVRCFDFLKAVK